MAAAISKTTMETPPPTIIAETCVSDGEPEGSLTAVRKPMTTHSESDSCTQPPSPGSVEFAAEAEIRLEDGLHKHRQLHGDGDCDDDMSSEGFATVAAEAKSWSVEPWHHAFYHTTTSVLGINVLLSLPRSFAYLGWVGGIVLLLASAVASYRSATVLINMQEPSRHKTYSEVADAAMWPGFSNVWVRPLQFLLFFQVTVLDALVTGQSFQTLAQMGGTGALANLSLSWWIVVAGIIIFAIGLIPTLTQTWHVSFVGTITAIIGTIILVIGCGISISDGSREEIRFDRPVVVAEGGGNLDYAMGVLNAFGLIAFAYGGHSVLPDVQASLHRDNAEDSHGVMLKGLRAAYGAIFPSYLLITVIGYAAFGADVSAFLLDNLQLHVSEGFLIFIYVIVIVNGLALGAVYVQACFTLIAGVFPFTERDREHDHNSEGRYGWAQLLARFVYVALCTFFAAAIPFFGSLAALSGAICFTPLTFVYPFVFWTRSKNLTEEASRWEYGLNCTFSILFGLLGIGGAIGALYFIVEESSTYKFFQLREMNEN